MNYDNYADLFDKVFPLNATTLKFLKDEFAAKKSILDLCCGRGLYTYALAQNFDVYGVDLSPKMIESARAQFPTIPFEVADMRNFQGNFDGIFIIGNSLVHLDSAEAIKNECVYLNNHLNSHGKLVVQIINYDRIYKYQIGELPQITKDDIRFVRKYKLMDEKTIFSSTLYCGEEKFEQSVALYPLKTQQLVKFLHEAGFVNIKIFGGFGRQEFLIDSSMQLVVTAEKLT